MGFRHGTLTLSGTTTLANYQAALRSIGYINSSQNPVVAARTISIVVGDGSDSSVIAARAAAITAVNDVPGVVASGGTVSYTEDGPATTVDAGLTVSDVDSTTLTRRDSQISSGCVTSQDLLTFIGQLGHHRVV